MKKKGNITSEHWFIPLVPSFQNFPKSKNLLFQLFLKKFRILELHIAVLVFFGIFKIKKKTSGLRFFL